jgi:hypothetical protein
MNKWPVKASLGDSVKGLVEMISLDVSLPPFRRESEGTDPNREEYLHFPRCQAIVKSLRDVSN